MSSIDKESLEASSIHDRCCSLAPLRGNFTIGCPTLSEKLGTSREVTSFLEYIQSSDIVKLPSVSFQHWGVP